MIKTFSFRSNLLGDIISSEPILRAIEEKYPGAHHVVGIAKKCKSAAKFLEGHDLISEIIISQDDEGNIYEYEDVIFDQRKFNHNAFEYQVNLNPQVVDNQWYNEMSIVQQNFRMCFGGDKEYDLLTRGGCIPRLRWFGEKVILPPNKPNICLQTLCAYGRDTLRSPSPEFWQKFINQNSQYNFWQIGHPLDTKLDNVTNLTELDFYEQIGYGVSSDLFIGLENGLTCLVKAISCEPTITLHTNWAANHHQNFDAWLTPHARNRNINVFGLDSIHNIKVEDLQNSLDKILN